MYFQHQYLAISFEESVPIQDPDEYVDDHFIAPIYENAFIFFAAMAGVTVLKMFIFR